MTVTPVVEKVLSIRPFSETLQITTYLDGLKYLEKHFVIPLN